MTWRSAPLGELCEIVSGATPRTDERRFWDGNIAWTTPKDISDLDTPFLDRTARKITEEGLKSCAASILPPNSVLLSSRAPIGLVAINSVPMATNQGYKSLVPKFGKLDSKFLFYWLKSKTAHLQSLGNGATFKEISKAVVERIEIPLPPLDEQRRIAAVLDKADGLRCKRRYAIGLLDGLTQSIFQRMFGDETNIVQLGTICSRVTDGTHQAPNWADEGIPFLFVSNVRNQSISFETSKFVSEKEFLKLTKNAPIDVGDVLYTAVGSYGNSAVVDTREKFVFQRHIAHLKLLQSRVAPLYLSIALESRKVAAQADRVARGVAQKTVTLDSLKKFLIPLPSIKRQQEFVGLAELIRGNESRMRKEQSHLNTLFSSLQHRAFSGQL